jgi:signal transduction histidine kinase
MGLRGLVDTVEKDSLRAAQQARQLQVLATDGLDELRHMVAGLHPPQLDDLGLVSAIRSLGREVSELSGLSVNVVNEMHGRKLPQETRVVLFRIAQEALTNVVRHAFASEVTVRLTCTKDQIQLEVLDNGQGFDEQMINLDLRHPNLGLLGMVERAALIGGTCQVHSKPGGGTKVLVQAPLKIQESDHA